jgi:hypothetical protein
MKKLTLKGMSVLLVVTISVGLILFRISEGWTQEKHKISSKWVAENSKYTQQHGIDVGEVPGHQVHIFEIQRTYPKDPPVFEEVVVKEAWFHGYSDYTDINGRTWGYGTYVLENGDKIFARFDGTTQTTMNPDGSKKTANTSVETLSGGTGKCREIRGILRNTVIPDLKVGTAGQSEGEYWIEE